MEGQCYPIYLQIGNYLKLIWMRMLLEQMNVFGAISHYSYWRKYSHFTITVTHF